MPSKVYIIGPMKDVKSLHTQQRFLKAQKQLEHLNLKVFNPLNSFLFYRESKEKAVRCNLHGLLDSNAVYVLKDAMTGSMKDQAELILAMKMNLLIMHEF
ncbi:DUF4406 domain-containing protein [Flavobacterium mekongense]|uniref:DUF4406 domain-containing protein n=1 Tax=Flavobacterium mekongense TaxID=3379707 RepID=UPI00399A047A